VDVLGLRRAFRSRASYGWIYLGILIGRHIREDKIGLNFARARGFQEAQGEVAVFVDVIFR